MLQWIALLLYTHQIYQPLLLIIVLVTFDSLVFLAYFSGAITVYLLNVLLNWYYRLQASSVKFTVQSTVTNTFSVRF